MRIRAHLFAQDTVRALIGFALVSVALFAFGYLRLGDKVRGAFFPVPQPQRIALLGVFGAVIAAAMLSYVVRYFVLDLSGTLSIEDGKVKYRSLAKNVVVDLGDVVDIRYGRPPTGRVGGYDRHLFFRAKNMDTSRLRIGVGWSETELDAFIDAAKRELGRLGSIKYEEAPAQKRKERVL